MNILFLEICLGWIDQSQAWLCSKLMGISEVWLGYTIMTGYGTKIYWGEVSWEDLSWWCWWLAWVQISFLGFFLTIFPSLRYKYRICLAVECLILSFFAAALMVSLSTTIRSINFFRRWIVTYLLQRRYHHSFSSHSVGFPHYSSSAKPKI